jgi:hypothetical protein
MMFDAIPNGVRLTLTYKMDLQSHLEFLHQIVLVLVLLSFIQLPLLLLQRLALSSLRRFDLHQLVQ